MKLNRVERSGWATLATICIVAVTTVPAAIIQGRYAHRWGEPQGLSYAAEVLHEFPLEFGDWRYVGDSRSLSASIRSELQISSYISRNYEHGPTGSRVTLLLMVGPPGPLVRHPPTRCYGNRPTVQLGAVQRCVLVKGDGNQELNRIRCRSSDILIEDFDVLFGFASGSRWSHPASPRVEFGGQPLIYKIQILNTVSSGGTTASPNGNAGLRFASDFTQAFDQFVKRRASD